MGSCCLGKPLAVCHVVSWHTKSCWQGTFFMSIVVAQERFIIAKKAEEDYQTQLKEASGLFAVPWQFCSLQQLQATSVAVQVM